MDALLTDAFLTSLLFGAVTAGFLVGAAAGGVGGMGLGFGLGAHSTDEEAAKGK